MKATICFLVLAIFQGALSAPTGFGDAAAAMGGGLAGAGGAGGLAGAAGAGGLAGAGGAGGLAGAAGAGGLGGVGGLPGTGMAPGVESTIDHASHADADGTSQAAMHTADEAALESAHIANHVAPGSGNAMLGAYGTGSGTAHLAAKAALGAKVV